MRLDQALTVAGLRAAAGSTTFERGRDYYARGAVRDLEVEAAAARATVVGETRYRTELAWGRNGLHSSCSCPYDWGTACKHVVALGLAVLDRAPRAAPPPGERVGFASREALEAWAAERQVTHALARPAVTLADRMAVAPGWLFSGGRTIADVAVASTTIEPPAVAAARVAVARAACAALEDEAALVRAGLEEEARLLAATPAPGWALAWRQIGRAHV